MKRAALWSALFLASSLLAQGHSGSCTCGGFGSTRVQWEIEHRDAPQCAAAAAAELDRWNRYLDIFDYRAGDGSQGPNGVNEIGFMDGATASARYGINLSPEVFAITFMTPLTASGEFDACPLPRDVTCGTFTETDVVLNSQFVRGFKPSGPPDFEDRGPALYGATAVHELGHAIGFHHNFQNLSVMNYYEDFAAQYIAAADTQEARRAYPSRTRQVHDLATYPFSFDSNLSDYAATTHVDIRPTRVARGGSITLRNFGLENVGSENASTVQLRVYLSTDLEITTADILIGTLVFDGPVLPGAFWDDEGGGRTLTIPADVAAGTYSIGALITDAAGAVDLVTYNNSWVAPQLVTITSGADERRRAVRH